MSFDLYALREGILRRTIRLDVSGHATIEAAKEGFRATDLRHAVMEGEVIERYPGRARALLLAFALDTALPMHVVLEHRVGEEYATIVTVYLPDDTEWWPGYRTRR